MQMNSPPQTIASSLRKRRVGILDLLNDGAPLGWDRVYASHFRRQFTSITPQAVSVWCRELGHDVFYATYFGQQDPKELVPDDLDIVFIGAFTKASALAYALAKLYRTEGALTVVGGPHARSFPQDCLRFFDVVIKDCDKQLVKEILDGHIDPGATVSSGRPLNSLNTLPGWPSVEQRMPELLASSLHGKRAVWKAVPILSSVGCPYSCDFCVDWNQPYARVPREHLENDLRYLADNHPGTLVAYHDPNFGVQFDQTMDAIETVPAERRNPYVMESSLSILKGARLERLARTGCAYIAAGVESWEEYSNKSAASGTTGRKKLDRVTEHFRLLHRHIKGFQGNFVFGNDADRGREPLELTKEFVRRLPFVWPGVNIPTPFGGTPLFDKLMRDGRILEAMPFSFYYNPYLTFVLANYHPSEYYEMLSELFSEMTSARAWVKRLTSDAPPLVKFIHSVQAFGVFQELVEFRVIRKLLATDSQFRGFHEGRDKTLPEFYHRRFEERLGRYAELVTRADRTPGHAEIRADDEVTLGTSVPHTVSSAMPRERTPS
ncbi:MAG: hypothetical protein BMS9Abin37_1443 [Acidobacteriota bacterium]|nr:MAG: hypothetical protein BMS9Abin37_1443 [Acidobacteriota bacterium]